MKKFFLLIPAFVLLLASCTTPKILLTKPVSQLQAQETPSMIYSLPRTGFTLQLGITRSVYIPGPYAEFAAKYLGVENVLQESQVKWNIVSADVKVFTEADPEMFYCISGPTEAFDLSSLIRLGKEGLIADPSLAAGNRMTAPMQQAAPSGPWFLNTSYKDLLREKTDTLYKTILEDSVLVKIPVFRKVTEFKTKEDRAKETAHLIHRLRKRFIKMISDDYPSLPQGEAMTSALKELKKTESLYTNLFTGITYTDTLIQQWVIIPQNKTDDEVEIGRFSTDGGLLPAGAGEGQPLSWNIKINPTTNTLPDFTGNLSNVIYYRVPETVSLEFRSGVRSLLACSIPVYQFGKIVPLRIPPKGK